MVGTQFLGHGAVEVDPELVIKAMQRGFDGMNALFDRHHFPKSELEATSLGLVEVLEQAGMA